VRSPPGELWLFGRQVVDLVREFPNVYFEVGYLDKILHQGGDKQLIARLETSLSLKSADGSYQVGDRIMSAATGI
jgi:hypothetical protein